MKATRRLLTSLLLVEEKLLEANFFVQMMRKVGPGESFGYCLSAFVSASRSVSFLLQKEMAHVPGFPAWWVRQQEILRTDPAARFFLLMRNYSQKEGRISLVGAGSTSDKWTYRFGGNSEKVPSELLKRDVSDCCMEHTAKLAKMVLACADEFPFHTCPRRAATAEGLAFLGLTVEKLAAALGWPPEWIAAGSSFSTVEQLALLRRDIDGVDFIAIQKLAEVKAREAAPGAAETLGTEWVDLVVEQLESGGKVDRATVIGAMLLSGGFGKQMP